MSRRARGLVLVSMLLAAVGCSAPGPATDRSVDGWPSQEVRLAASRESFERVSVLADELLARVRAQNPGLVFELNYLASRDDGWLTCAFADTGEAPESVLWSAQREISVEPRQATVGLVWPLIEDYVADGWVVRRDTLDEDVLAMLTMGKDGILVRISARSQDGIETTGLRAHLDIHVMSPCQYAPDGLAEFDGDDPEAFLGPVDVPAVVPGRDPAVSTG